MIRTRTSTSHTLHSAWETASRLASRARRRIQAAATTSGTDPGRQREVVAAFVAASRHGDFDALLALLDPDVVLRADGAAVQMGASKEVRGAAAVADHFSKRARTVQRARINGPPERCGLRADNHVSPSPSRSQAEGSPLSNWSLTPSGSATSTWRSSTTDKPHRGAQAMVASCSVRTEQASAERMSEGFTEGGR